MDNIPVFIRGKRPNDLSIEQVREIRNLLKDGVPVKVIAIDYNRHPDTISLIKTGVSYRNVL